MFKLFHRVFADERGATTAEYGLVAALVAVAIVGTLTTLGGDLSARSPTFATRPLRTRPDRPGRRILSARSSD